MGLRLPVLEQVTIGWVLVASGGLGEGGVVLGSMVVVGAVGGSGAIVVGWMGSRDGDELGVVIGFVFGVGLLDKDCDSSVGNG